MDIIYKWVISGIDGTPKTADGLENVARVIHWICTGCVEDYSSICNSRQGFVILDAPGANFIDYSDVTEDIAFSWLFSKLNKVQVEADIANALSEADTLISIEAKTPLGMQWSMTTPTNVE